MITEPVIRDVGLAEPQPVPPTTVAEPVGSPLLAMATILTVGLIALFGSHEPTQLVAALAGLAASFWLYRIFRARGQVRR
ncbi:hypothetical protein [Amycolatopsis japonica]